MSDSQDSNRDNGEISDEKYSLETPEECLADLSASFETIFVFGLLEILSAPFDFGFLALIEFIGGANAYDNLAVISRARS